MLTLSSSVRIYAALGATDMRKSFDGLSALAGEMVGADPTSGHLFLFCNRRKTGSNSYTPSSGTCAHPGKPVR